MTEIAFAAVFNHTNVLLNMCIDLKVEGSDVSSFKGELIIKRDGHYPQEITCTTVLFNIIALHHLLQEFYADFYAISPHVFSLNIPSCSRVSAKMKVE